MSKGTQHKAVLRLSEDKTLGRAELESRDGDRPKWKKVQTLSCRWWEGIGNF